MRDDAGVKVMRSMKSEAPDCKECERQFFCICAYRNQTCFKHWNKDQHCGFEGKK